MSQKAIEKTRAASDSRPCTGVKAIPGTRTRSIGAKSVTIVLAACGRQNRNDFAAAPTQICDQWRDLRFVIKRFEDEQPPEPVSKPVARARGYRFLMIGRAGLPHRAPATVPCICARSSCLDSSMFIAAYLLNCGRELICFSAGADAFFKKKRGSCDRRPRMVRMRNDRRA